MDTALDIRDEPYQDIIDALGSMTLYGVMEKEAAQHLTETEDWETIAHVLAREVGRLRRMLAHAQTFGGQI